MPQCIGGKQRRTRRDIQSPAQGSQRLNHGVNHHGVFTQVLGRCEQTLSSMHILGRYGAASRRAGERIDDHPLAEAPHQQFRGGADENRRFILHMATTLLRNCKGVTVQISVHKACNKRTHIGCLAEAQIQGARQYHLVEFAALQVRKRVGHRSLIDCGGRHGRAFFHRGGQGSCAQSTGLRSLATVQSFRYDQSRRTAQIKRYGPHDHGPLSAQTLLRPVQ